MDEDAFENPVLVRRVRRDRDRIWCQALIELLDISDIARVTRRVNEIRPDKEED